MNIMHAMATMEGFYKPGSRAFRNNNPGNLVYGPYTHNSIGSDGRFAKFKTQADGFNEFKRWLSVSAKFENKGTPEEKLVGGYLGATIRQVIFRWTPQSENDSENYLKVVCNLADLDPNDILTPDILNRA